MGVDVMFYIEARTKPSGKVVFKGKSKLIYLCDNSVEIDGIRFYGTPWIADLARWAFYKPEDELKEAYANIPKKCDVLLTHIPPDA